MQDLKYSELENRAIPAEIRDEVKKLISNGVDPSVVKKAQKASQQLDDPDTNPSFLMSSLLV